MSEQTLFMYTNVGDYEQHKVIKTDHKTAQQVKSDGNAVDVSLGDYDIFRERAKKLHSDYKKAERRINQNDSPQWTAEVKDYELKKVFDEYEKSTKQAQSEYEQSRKQMQADARATAARATVRVGESDRQTAEQIAARISLSVAGSSNAANLTAAVSQASDDITYLTDAEKTSLQGKLSGIIGQIEAKSDKFGANVSSRKLIGSVQDVRNMDLLGGKVAEQLPDNVDIEYRQLKLIRKGRTSSVRGV